MEVKVDAQTKQKIKEIELGVQKKSKNAMDQLMDLVLDINPKLHPNLRLDE